VAREAGIKLVTLDELIASSDYLTLHVGLTPQTTGVINAKTLAKMKKGVRIINCARGELIEDADLVAALKSGQVAGAAARCVCRGAAQGLALLRIGQRDPHAPRRRLHGRSARGSGDSDRLSGARLSQAGRRTECRHLPSLSHEEYKLLAPFIDMAGRLGSFLAQAGKSGIESIDLVYGGTLVDAKTELVRNAAIAGLLEGSENVNRINAATVAQERGIRIHEQKSETHRGGAASVLTVELHTAAGTSRASATVIHGEQPRLLEFDSIDIETPLEGNLLVCRNLDVPG